MKFILNNENNEYHLVACNIYHLLFKTLPKIKNFYISLRLNNFKLFEFCLKGYL